MSTGIVYNSFWEDLFKGQIDVDSDTFKCMLTTGYTANKDTHTKRSDVTGEVSGTGYTAGGPTVTVTVAKNTATDTATITLGGLALSAATVSATGAVFYKSRGGASSADELVAAIDFGGTVSSTADTWTLTASTITLDNSGA